MFLELQKPVGETKRDKVRTLTRLCPICKHCSRSVWLKFWNM